MFNYGKTNISLLIGDITKVETEAIVNAANNTLLGGGGVDGAIHRAGGRSILEQCQKLGGCPTGEARITTAGNLPSKYVIHTVGPIYKNGSLIQEKLLYNAYYNSLSLAREYKLESIAFPSISTGAYNYPIEEAAEIAIRASIDFLNEANNLKQILYLVYNQKDYEIYMNKLKEILP